MSLFDFFTDFKKAKTKIKVTKVRPTMENNINEVYKTKLSNGLLPGEVVLLDWFTGKSIDNKPPEYFKYKYGINAEKSLKKLIIQKYLEESSTLESLHALKINDLKIILKDFNLKVTGKKDDLIERIKENITKDKVNKYIVEKFLKITKKGNETLKEFYYIVPAHKNNSKDGVYDVDSAIEFVKNFIGNHSPSNSEIFWTLLQDNYLVNKKKGNYGLARNNLLSMAIQLKKENKLEDSLIHYLKVFIMDMSGLGNNSLDHPKLIIVAPGINSMIISLKKELQLDESKFKALFERSWSTTRSSIPFHYLTEDECFKCLHKAFSEDRESIRGLIEQKFKALNKADFEEKYNIHFPINL